MKNILMKTNKLKINKIFNEIISSIHINSLKKRIYIINSDLIIKICKMNKNIFSMKIIYIFYGTNKTIEFIKYI